jgi:hypothetical protein
MHNASVHADLIRSIAATSTVRAITTTRITTTGTGTRWRMRLGVVD